MSSCPVPAVILDDPVDQLFAFHRKVERQLAVLGRLPVHLELHGVDPEASAAALASLDCFGPAMAAHQADEEGELLPLIERRIGRPEDRERFVLSRERIERDHRALADAWRGLRRPLGAIAEGLRRELPEGVLGYFRALTALHISAEEATVHVMAHRYLAPADRAAIARRMLARRAARKASSG